MRVGIIRETKTPVDNRVPLTPCQCVALREAGIEVVVERSAIRAYRDEEYAAKGIDMVDRLADTKCDIRLGVKEVNCDCLEENCHYLFFSHIAKLQPYNRALLLACLEKHITLTDYEYLVGKEGNRLVYFGFFAGAVGVYNTLRLYGVKYNLYALEKPQADWSVERLAEEVGKIIPFLTKRKTKVLITGTGHVSEGAQFVLDKAGMKKRGASSYIVIPTDLMVRRKGQFSTSDFHQHPDEYESWFDNYIGLADILVACHYWDCNAPRYFTRDLMMRPNNRIKVVGDITCDINGSIECTVRPSTHDEPFYDYLPETGKEVTFGTNDNAISVMAVDTCPNALPRDASEKFGEMLIENVLLPMANGDTTAIDNATLVRNGEISSRFSYLKDFVYGKG